MRLDAPRSRLTIFTETEGLFSALAHDLEIVAGDLRGEANEATAEVRVQVASINVTAVMKRGRRDEGILSRADRDAIDRQIREEVLPATELIARGTMVAGRASVEIVAPGGNARAVTCEVVVTQERDWTRTRGRAEVSLRSIGAPPVKGPLGSFRVKDRVRVEFDLFFVADR
jgi:hypothetical protein